MASGFSVFRRHQKAIFAVLTVMCMIAFTVGGVLTRFIGPGDSGKQPVGTIDGEDLTRRDFDGYRQSRYLANQAGLVISMNRESSLYGSADDHDIWNMILMLRLADEMGIQISDDYVHTHLNMQCNRLADLPEMTQELFGNIRQRTGRSRDSIFEAIRNELKIETVRTIIHGQVTFSPWELARMEQYFSRKATIQAVRVPVAAFYGRTADPTEQELRAHFDKFKDQAPGDGPGQYGYRPEPRVQIEYVMADIGKFTEKVVVTEEEIALHYLAVRDFRYRLDDDDDDDDAPPTAPATQTGTQPDDATATAPATQLGPMPRVTPDGPIGAGTQPAPATQDTSATQPETADTQPTTQPDTVADSQPTTQPRYKLLSDVREEIRKELQDQRELIAKQAAAKVIEKRIDKFAMELGREQDPTKVDVPKLARELGLTYGGKHWLTRRQAEHFPGLGRSRTMAKARVAGRPFAEDVFLNNFSDKPKLQDDAGNRYVYRKLEHVDPEEVSFQDVAEQVTADLRLERARPLAQQRAQQLLALVEKADNDMEAALKDEPEELHKPKAFARLGYRSLEWNRPDELPEADRPFLTAVFEKLVPGEVKVLANGPQTVFYLVKLIERDKVTDEQLRGVFSSRPSMAAYIGQYRFLEDFQRYLRQRYDARIAPPAKPEPRDKEKEEDRQERRPRDAMQDI